MYTIVYTRTGESIMNVSVREFRARLKYYLDQLQKGEEVNIIRNSLVIGRLVPSDEVKKEIKAVSLVQNPTGVKFRRFEMYEDSGPLRQLHRRAQEAAGAFVEDPELDKDLDSTGSQYEKLGGEFWIGELDDEIVATGGFRMNWGTKSGEGEAELKRMRVKPELQGQHIGGQLLELLEDRARKFGYKSMVLDVTSAKEQESAHRFYEKHGYKETGREQTKHFELIYCRKTLNVM